MEYYENSIDLDNYTTNVFVFDFSCPPEQVLSVWSFLMEQSLLAALIEAEMNLGLILWF